MLNFLKEIMFFVYVIFSIKNSPGILTFTYFDNITFNYFYYVLPNLYYICYMYRIACIAYISYILKSLNREHHTEWPFFFYVTFIWKYEKHIFLWFKYLLLYIKVHYYCIQPCRWDSARTMGHTSKTGTRSGGFKEEWNGLAPLGLNLVS